MWDTLEFVRAQLAIELNAANANPLVIVEEERVVSVSNVDVIPLAAALDFLRIALAPALTSANKGGKYAATIQKMGRAIRSAVPRRR